MGRGGERGGEGREEGAEDNRGEEAVGRPPVHPALAPAPAPASVSTPHLLGAKLLQRVGVGCLLRPHQPPSADSSGGAGRGLDGGVEGQQLDEADDLHEGGGAGRSLDGGVEGQQLNEADDLYERKRERGGAERQG